MPLNITFRNYKCINYLSAEYISKFMHRLKNDGIPKIFTELIKNAKTEIIFFYLTTINIVFL